MTTNLPRRRFLGMTAAATASSGLAATSVQASNSPASPDSLRFAHLPDIHMMPGRGAPQKFARCLEAVEDGKPKFAITGGDQVYNVLRVSEAEAQKLFDLYQGVVREHTKLPFHHCVGNADAFGWNRKFNITPDHPLYGKQMFRERFGLDRTYYRFDDGGWRFYVLDNVQPTFETAVRGLRANDYQGDLDEAQQTWLEDDLRAKPPEMPAVVVCHIPILSVTYFDDHIHVWREEESGYFLHVRLMARRAAELTQLFSRHNVKLVLTGHMHRRDRCEYRGVTFICGGAVCGHWWHDPDRDPNTARPGFGLIDLRPDGTFDYRYVEYGWG